MPDVQMYKDGCGVGLQVLWKEKRKEDLFILEGNLMTTLKPNNPCIKPKSIASKFRWISKFKQYF